MTTERRTSRSGRVKSLETVNGMLDELVKRRTLDLVAANQRLLQEIASRKRVEDELQRSRTELNALTEGLRQAQEEEWRRLAQDLADELVGIVRKVTERQLLGDEADGPALAVHEGRAATTVASPNEGPAARGVHPRHEERGATGAPPRHASLSAREYQVFVMLATGLPIKEIAAQMEVARTTIASYRTRVLDKLGMTRNSELVRYALKHGLIS